MKQQQQQQQQQIEKLKNDEKFLQFALPKGGRGFVTKNNELILSINGKLKHYGYFKKAKNDNEYYFIYKVGPYDLPEVIYSIDKDITNDIYDFSLKLSCFFELYPNYKGLRYHDWDVLLGSNLKVSSTINTPLYRAGFRIKAYSKN